MPFHDTGTPDQPLQLLPKGPCSIPGNTPKTSLSRVTSGGPPEIAMGDKATNKVDMAAIVTAVWHYRWYRLSVQEPQRDGLFLAPRPQFRYHQHHPGSLECRRIPTDSGCCRGDYEGSPALPGRHRPYSEQCPTQPLALTTPYSFVMWKIPEVADLYCSLSVRTGRRTSSAIAASRSISQQPAQARPTGRGRSHRRCARWPQRGCHVRAE